MLHKCANPDCVNSFRKLTQGKLFLVETGRANGAAETVDWKHSQRKIEYFWLCDQCAPRLTLTYERGRGVVTIPLVEAQVKKPPVGEFRQLPMRDEVRGDHRYAKRA
jgi:hypothetical protein